MWLDLIKKFYFRSLVGKEYNQSIPLAEYKLNWLEKLHFFTIHQHYHGYNDFIVIQPNPNQL